MKKEFILTIILKEEAKNFSLPKDKAENLLNSIIAQNKSIINFDKKGEIIEMIKSSDIISVQRLENQIIIRLE